MHLALYERKIIVGNEDQLSNEEFLLYVACIISVSINLRQMHCMNLSDDWVLMREIVQLIPVVNSLQHAP